LPACVMIMEMLMGMLAVLVRIESGVGMAVELLLILKGTIQFQWHVLNRAMMMAMVAVIMGCRRKWLIMQAQAHAQAGVQFGMIGHLQKTNLRRFLPNQLLGLHKGFFGEIIDLVEDHHVCILQLLMEDRVN